MCCAIGMAERVNGLERYDCAVNPEPSTQPELVAVAHDLASLHNVGAIFRTADGAGFSRVITSGYTGGPPDKRISKVALDA